MTETRHIEPHQPPSPNALLDFLHAESAAGITLIIAAIAALIWSNIDAATYEHFLHWPLTLGVTVHQPLTLRLGVEHWINDGLMAIFFLQVGLEIRRELTEGHLNSLSRAAGPGVAALGGMVVPALVFLAFNYNSAETLRGWAIPVATDIAFALAALSALGNRVPVGLKVFLTALAIIDDLGAILVIAFFYSGQLNTMALAGAAGIWVILWLLNRLGVRSLFPFLIGGVALWACVLQSGIHATLAGVALAFVIPGTKGGVSPANELEHSLGPWVAWLVLPAFGLANAGLQLDQLDVHQFASPVVVGIVLGLFLGKQVGIFVTTAICRALGLIRLPSGLTLSQVYAAAILCGIGFTMSLFIGDLSFGNNPAVHAQVKLAVFAASLVSAVVGLGVLAVATRNPLQSSAETAPETVET
jgi:Na+:H+ antiporter, NhaA family